MSERERKGERDCWGKREGVGGWSWWLSDHPESVTGYWTVSQMLRLKGVGGVGGW